MEGIPVNKHKPTPFPFPLLLRGILGLVRTHLSLFPVPAAIFVVALIRKTKPGSLLSPELQGRVLSLTRCSPDKCDPDCDFLRKLLNTDCPAARSLEFPEPPRLVQANNEFSKQMSCEMVACE